jgi:hypothetical protein
VWALRCKRNKQNTTICAEHIGLRPGVWAQWGTASIRPNAAWAGKEIPKVPGNRIPAGTVRVNTMNRLTVSPRSDKHGDHSLAAVSCLPRGHTVGPRCCPLFPAQNFAVGPRLGLRIFEEECRSGKHCKYACQVAESDNTSVTRFPPFPISVWPQGPDSTVQTPSTRAVSAS